MTTTSEPHFHPWGVVTPDFWHNPARCPPRPLHPPAAPTSGIETRPAAPQDPSEIPPELLPMIKEINRAINARRLPKAAALAAAAETHISTTYGEAHIYTANIRALQAFIAERVTGSSRY